jgi:hypothetical protein
VLNMFSRRKPCFPTLAAKSSDDTARTLRYFADWPLATNHCFHGDY